MHAIVPWEQMINQPKSACYTLRMSDPRILPLFDAKARPACWNERMQSGEYAVHDSSFDGSLSAGPSCTVFGSLAEAEAYARQQIAQNSTLRCRLYDHRGFVGQPVREFCGARYKGKSEISARFRRWVGSLLFFGGSALTAVDWLHDFRLSWPAMIGTRLMMPGMILLVMDLLIVVHERQKKHRALSRLKS